MNVLFGLLLEVQFHACLMILFGYGVVNNGANRCPWKFLASWNLRSKNCQEQGAEVAVRVLWPISIYLLSIVHYIYLYLTIYLSTMVYLSIISLSTHLSILLSYRKKATAFFKEITFSHNLWNVCSLNLLHIKSYVFKWHIIWYCPT